YARRYLNAFGWTMAFSVMVSLLVSITLTPMLSSRLLKQLSHKGDEPQQRAAGRGKHTSTESPFFRWLDGSYGRTLEWSLNHRWTTVLIALGIFALTFPLNKLVGRDFIPADDQSELQVFLNAPVGMSIYGTEKFAEEATDKIEHLDGV